MSDDPQYPARSDWRDEADASSPRDRRPHDSCTSCVTKTLRPYRVVKRYRGDRQVRWSAWENWSELWRLQGGDASWPDGRES